MKIRLHHLFLPCFSVVLSLFPAQAPAASQAEYTRTVERYEMPDVTLINQDGKRIKFRELMNSGKPVVVDFIYGTCTTICQCCRRGIRISRENAALTPQRSS